MDFVAGGMLQCKSGSFCFHLKCGRSFICISTAAISSGCGRGSKESLKRISRLSQGFSFLAESVAEEDDRKWPLSNIALRLPQQMCGHDVWVAKTGKRNCLWSRNRLGKKKELKRVEKRGKLVTKELWS